MDIRKRLYKSALAEAKAIDLSDVPYEGDTVYRIGGLDVRIMRDQHPEAPWEWQDWPELSFSVWTWDRGWQRIYSQGEFSPGDALDRYGRDKTLRDLHGVARAVWLSPKELAEAICAEWYAWEGGYDSRFEMVKQVIVDFLEVNDLDRIGMTSELYQLSGSLLASEEFNGPSQGQSLRIEVVGDRETESGNLAAGAAALMKEVRAWYDGDVFGAAVLDPETGDELESCWGFYGTDPEWSGIAEFIAETVAGHKDEKRRQHLARLKAQIKAHAPLQAREPLHA